MIQIVFRLNSKSSMKIMDLAYTLITGKIKIGGKFNNDKIDKKKKKKEMQTVKIVSFFSNVKLTEKFLPGNSAAAPLLCH